MADLLKDTELRKLDRETKRRTNGWTDRQASRQAGRQAGRLLNRTFNSQKCVYLMGERIQSVSLINNFLAFCKHNSLLPYLSMFGDSLDIILKQISCHLLNTHLRCLLYVRIEKNKHSH